MGQQSNKGNKVKMVNIAHVVLVGRKMHMALEIPTKI